MPGRIMCQTSAFSHDYIFRVYRCDGGNACRLVGTAEEVGTTGRKAFTTIEELWEILRARMEKKTNDPAE